VVKPINTSGFKQSTGRDFEGWLKYLRSISADELSHAEIAAHLEHKAGLSDWWAQSVTVAYEQATGRRVPGQRANGGFSVSVSRTFAGEPGKYFEAWSELMAGETKIAGHKLLAEPTTTRARSGLNWRCKLDDGSKAVIGFVELPAGKTRAGLDHSDLATGDEMSKVKNWWAKKLDVLKALQS
jgi:hypothetical protein